jgi:hypothetical protein
LIEGLSEEDYLHILFAAEAIDGVVIGGQALNLWASALLSDHEFDGMGPFTSKDIDFWGDRQAARMLADALDGRLLVPNDPFSTVSAAAVEVEFDGKFHQIDFLNTVCGLNTKDFLRRAQDVDVGGAKVAVLHPMDVMKSRIAGLLVLRRKDTGAIRQLMASPFIVQRFIEQRLDAGAIKEAQDLVREFLYEGSKQTNDRLFRDHGFDVVSLVLTLASRSEWHPNFSQHQIQRKAEKALADRERRMAEAARKSQGEPSLPSAASEGPR